jgi:antitoxin component of MazEF toxin-antitoxin module
MWVHRAYGGQSPHGGDSLVLKRLTRHGNSTALVLDKTLMALLNLHPDSVVQIEVTDGKLIVTPARDEEHEDKRTRKFREVQQRVHARYAETFKRLAE